MRIGSLCSGFGGVEMAVERHYGASTAWHAENASAPSRVLAYHHPDTPNLGDLTTIDWTRIGRTPMAAPRCDERAQAMYDLYCQGLSLAGVAAEFDTSRQTVYKMFQRRGFNLRSRPPARPGVTFNGDTFTLGNHGYYRRTNGDRDLLHRVVWRKHHGEIPHGWDLHHRDGDKTNNDLGNLEAMPKAEHAHRYGTGCNGFIHRCGLEVVPKDSRVVDILTAGYP